MTSKKQQQVFLLIAELCDRNCSSSPFAHQKIPFFQMNLASGFSGVPSRDSHGLGPCGTHCRILSVLKSDGLERPVLVSVPVISTILISGHFSWRTVYHS